MQGLLVMVKLKNLLLERIILDVKVGDTILAGRFKNKNGCKGC